MKIRSHSELREAIRDAKKNEEAAKMSMHAAIAATAHAIDSFTASNPEPKFDAPFGDPRWKTKFDAHYASAYAPWAQRRAIAVAEQSKAERAARDRYDSMRAVRFALEGKLAIALGRDKKAAGIVTGKWMLVATVNGREVIVRMGHNRARYPFAELTPDGGLVRAIGPTGSRTSTRPGTVIVETEELPMGGAS